MFLFIRHFLEMVVAMAAGMMVLGPVRTLIVAHLGWSDLFDRPELHAGDGRRHDHRNVAVDALPQSQLDQHRGDGRRDGPSLRRPLRTVVGGYAVWRYTAMAGHLLMLPAMVIAMLHRRSEDT